MDKLIEMARAVAIALQNDERYTRAQMAQTAADADEELQELIGEFNLKRMSLNSEMGKDNKDAEKLKTLDAEVRELYSRVMGNEAMKEYQSVKGELDAVVNNMISLISMAAQGADPNEYDEESAGCGGRCDSCSGCH